MAVYFRYNDLSVAGICKTFSSILKVTMNEAGTIVFPNWLSSGYMQHVKLPNGFDIMFSEYDYKEDIIFAHQPEQTENFVLWIDSAEGPGQEYDIEGVVTNTTNVKQEHAYLMNSLQSVSHLRKKGSRGKSILIFLPYELFTAYFKEEEIKTRMNRLHKMPDRGLNYMVITPVEIKIIDSLFYQWNKYRNTLGMAKYVNQLLERFFIQLFQNVDEDIQKISITDAQQTDLEKLRNILEENITEERVEPDHMMKGLQTPYNELEKLFIQMYGKTVYEYFKTKKIEYAFNQLIHTNKSVADIAFEIGYANPSNFSNAFRKKYHINPQDMRTKKNISA